MDLPALTPSDLALALVVGGVAVALLAGRALARRRAERRHGRLESVDLGGGREVASARWRLVGRPDAIRRTRDGRAVPVEVKSRPAPRGGPAYSHLVQVWAYCLLLEDAEGRAPPMGVLRYADREFEVPWDHAARSELLRLRRAIDARYDGRATPSPAKCAHCPWRLGCDARAR